MSPTAPPGFRIDPEAPMRALIADLKRIERSGRDVSRREWLRLARRWVRAKACIVNGEVPFSPPMPRCKPPRPTR